MAVSLAGKNARKIPLSPALTGSRWPSQLVFNFFILKGGIKFPFYPFLMRENPHYTPLLKNGISQREWFFVTINRYK